MMHRRAKNLSDVDIKRIVEILDGWSTKLTWNLLIDEIAVRIYGRYTRQALFKHERIRNAYFLTKKNLLRDGGQIGPTSSPEVQIARQRIERFEAENRRLESENQRLLEQFTIWAFNASAHGFDYELLSQPLPDVNRGQTILRKKLDSN
jgi:hypothetical protein